MDWNRESSDISITLIKFLTKILKTGMVIIAKTAKIAMGE